MSATIVIGYTGSEGSERVLNRGIQEAKHGNGRLIVVIVAEVPLDPQAPSWNPVTVDSRDNPTAALGEQPYPPILEPIVQKARIRCRDAGVDADIIAEAGDFVHRILESARSAGATKILLGAHRRTHLGRLFGRDVGAAVRRHASCEVVVID